MLTSICISKERLLCKQIFGLILMKLIFLLWLSGKSSNADQRKQKSKGNIFHLLHHLALGVDIVADFLQLPVSRLAGQLWITVLFEAIGPKSYLYLYFWFLF